MRNPILIGAFTALLSGAALADDYRDLGYNDNRSRSYDGYHDRINRHRSPRRVSLTLRVADGGHGTIPLKRMLRHQHRIDTDRWRVRSVSVYSHRGTRDACADLRIGRYHTGPVYLRRGVTRIDAPYGDADGHWRLNVEGARVREVTVLLEPRHARYAYRDGGRRYERESYWRWALR